MHGRLNVHFLLSAAACLLAISATPAATADTKPAPAAAATAAPSPSYSAGLQVGESLHHTGVTKELDVDAFMHGLKDALAGKETTPEDREHVKQFVADVRNTVIAHNRAVGREFLEKNAKVQGVVTTASGLQYKILVPGDEKAGSPGPTDQVTVHYRGRLLDGTEFDSSYARGAPAPLRVNGVIKGWQEALVLMKPGAKWQLFIPAELAYDVNSPPRIPPASVLIFDVELVSVGGGKP